VDHPLVNLNNNFWRTRQSIFAGWSLPILHYASGSSVIDLGDKKYPKVEVRFNTYNVYTMYKRVLPFTGHECFVLEIRVVKQQD
jgi:hypothetical protein